MRRRRPSFVLSLPERTVRSVAALAGGTVHETAALALPRFVRRSRLYEVTAKNALRVVIELAGGVKGSPTAEPSVGAGRLAVRKGAGNIVELGSIAAFGFSPLWLLAAASDLTHGTRIYLRALTTELKRGGVLAPEAEIESVDELLSVLESGSGTMATLIDIPPVELTELRQSVEELRSDATDLPSPAELATAYRTLRLTADAEQSSLLRVSNGVGLAFLMSAKNLTRDELVVPYRDDWEPVRGEGFAGYARRVSGPYKRAVAAHFDPRLPTWTEHAVRLTDRQSRVIAARIVRALTTAARRVGLGSSHEPKS